MLEWALRGRSLDLSGAREPPALVLGGAGLPGLVVVLDHFASPFQSTGNKNASSHEAEEAADGHACMPVSVEEERSDQGDQLQHETIVHRGAPDGTADAAAAVGPSVRSGGTAPAIVRRRPP